MYQDYYNQQPSMDAEDLQILLAWLFFFWIIIPVMAVVGLVKIVIAIIKGDE